MKIERMPLTEHCLVINLRLSSIESSIQSPIHRRLNDFPSFQTISTPSNEFQLFPNSPFNSFPHRFPAQAQHIETEKLAAAKICELKGEDELEDFTVEIDILSECRHKNIVQLHEAFFYEGKLWVSGGF